MSTVADTLFREVLERVCRRPISMSVDEWADAHRVLVMSARRGPWQTESVPYLREIMRAYTDPIVREITVIKGAQLGGSEALYNMIMRDIDVDPRDTLLVYPTIEVARAVMKRRLAPAIQAVPTLRTHLSGKARDISALSMTFTGCTLAMVGSNSPSGLESFPLSRVFVDELDRCEPTTLEQVRERQKTFADAKLVKTGTPSMQGAGIDAEYRGVPVRDEDGSETGEFVGASSRRTYWVPCPECGTYHRRRFADIRWEGGSRADPAVVKRTAHMRCPARGCGAKILASSNLWQLRLGVWAPEGCRVTPLERERGGAGEGGEDSPGRAVDAHGRTPAFVEHEGFAITGLYSALEANPYGAVASKFLRGGCSWTENFVTRVIGMAYRPRGRSAAEAAVNALRDPSHAMRTVPPSAIRLTMAIDVQTDRAFVEVLAWGAFGRTCWLVDCFSVATTMGLNLAELDEVVLRRRWPKLAPEAKGPVPSAFLRPACVMIDTGDRTDEVYRAVKRWAAVPGAPAITPTKGDSTMGRGASPPHRLTVISPDRLKSDAAGIGAGLMLLLINTHYWKDTVLARLSGDRDGEREGLVEEWSSGVSGEPAAGPAPQYSAPAAPDSPSSPQAPSPSPSDVDRWIMPRDMPGEYARQLTSEHLVRRMVQGRPKYMWELKPGVSDNHFLDCRVMNMAGADLHGVGRMAPPPPPVPAPAASPATPPGPIAAPGNVKRADIFGQQPKSQNPSANRAILSASTLRGKG